MATRVALIGAHGHGLSHRRVIADLAEAGTVELVALGDVVPVPDAPPGVPVFADPAQLLAQTAPEVVIVCTPPHTHRALTTAALRAGADVLLEKPPAIDLAEHDALLAEVEATGRVCQVGFQALASPALAELLSIVDSGALGTITAITAIGAWKRDESYFHRAAWVGRASLDGRPVLDGALANPFAHAVMQVLAIARSPVTSVEVERYRTREIQVDDTATLRLRFAGGPTAVVAVTLCAEEFVPGEITVHGTEGGATLEYPTDRLRGPGDAEARNVAGRPGLLANLVAHRRDPSVELIVPLARTRPFTEVIETVCAAPAIHIGFTAVSTWNDLPHPRLVIDGINATLAGAAANLALLSELPATARS
jgi:predicted dehydrogenase